MKTPMGKSWLWDAALLLVASPVYALVALTRMPRRSTLARMTRQRTIPCPTCGAEIALMGFWQCGCGFTYQGHVLQLCPVCGTLPQLIRCEHCGATQKVPD